MSAFSLLIFPATSHESPSASYRTFCYPYKNICHVLQAVASVGCFRPATSSVQSNHRPVSYYAFLKEWLPPSPSSGCHQSITSFPTKQPLWDLNARSGLFPSRLWTLAPKVCLLVLLPCFSPVSPVYSFLIGEEGL